jgi:hypothetical protein
MATKYGRQTKNRYAPNQALQPTPLARRGRASALSHTMRLRLPLVPGEIAVPAWCVVAWLGWPLLFISFMIHSLIIGGDAQNGKVEDGKYYVFKLVRQAGEESRYTQVSKARYMANYVHGTVLIVLFIPAFIGTWRVVNCAGRQIQTIKRVQKRIR